MRAVPFVIVLGLAAGPALSQPTPITTPPVAPLSVKELMRHVVNPAAERFWKTSGSVSTEEGDQSRAPTSEASWTEMTDAGAILHEAGVTLGLPGRGPPNEDWKRFAKQLADGGLASMAAARAKNADKAFEAGGEVYNACFNCHAKYIPRPANSLWKQP
ncbi:hypothetical protein [Phenylobacterium sp.]|uniref:hypothetical protein n=1 Tax=Phenylobacterium sp. TaxID=1871053 RepID=UPI002F942463